MVVGGEACKKLKQSLGQALSLPFFGGGRLGFGHRRCDTNRFLYTNARTGKLAREM